MIRLLPCLKTYSQDQDKAASPAATLATVRERLASLSLSILAETRRVDNGRLGIPVFLSICGQDAAAVMPTRKQMGKGASPEQAEASALMELMERYGFFSYWDDPPQSVSATWSEAERRFGSALMPLEEVIKACQDSIPADDARRVMDLRRWLFVPAMRIADEETVYVPLDLFRKLGEFNGSSAGNTDAESILQGACELVERHCCCLAYKNKDALPTIDLAAESLNDPVLMDLAGRFHANGITLLLKDFSYGMPIPTVAALAYDPATFPEQSEIVFTAGTASSPAKAAIRALTEVAQLAGDFNSSACYEASGLPKYATLDQCAWLRQGPVVPLDTLPSVESADILDELRTLAQRLKKQGTTLYSVATTNSQTRVPSHYSFVPGFLFRERDANASLGLFAGRCISEEASADEAEQAFAVLEAIYPGAHFLPFFKAMAALKEGRLNDAAALFEAAEKRQPEADSRALAAFYRGYCSTLAEQWEKALPHLERAVTLCPDMKEYRNLKGVCLFKLGQYREAAQEFADIITRLDKGSVMDLQNLGLCHKFLGNKQEAVRYLLAALSINPGLAAARQHLAELEHMA